jgi:hypothetical protein
MATNSFGLMVGDAPTPYGDASHTTAEWQMIGSSSSADDGVWWSTDGGTTWGNDAVYVGDQIQFKFALWSAGYGNHTYDQIKAWVDWDQDFDWENDDTEVILAEKYYKDSDAINDDTVANFDYGAYTQYAETNDFYSGTYYISEEMVEGLWLRARAQCNHVPYDTMTPYGNLWQGEVEDWFITVSPVPEPATMLLLGFGLIGIAGASRKKLFKK